MMRYSFFIGAIILFSLINGERITAPTEVFIPRQITAGDPLVFTFTEADRSSKLYVENGYGQTIILPSSENVHLFQVPSFISEKSGTLEWKFLNAKKNRAGVVQISAQEVPRLIENYFGPRSIQAGDNDYSMLVSIPTDKLDNPLSDGTKVNFSEYFQGNLINDSIPMRNMFAWKNVYTKRKAANITVSASAEDLQSKEMISQVYPSVATDFMISTRREHEFADGNQVIDVVTSPIVDAYGNVVSDGTFVEFIIENKEGMILKSSATTISGVATVKFLHPEQPEEWKLSANVTGMAKTPTILVDFRSVLEDFQIKLIRDANRIEVGPLESFLGQWVADGTTVRVEILDSNSKSILELQEPSEDGFATFNLPSDKKNWNSYTFRIEAMGLIKLMDAGKDQ